MKLEQQVTSLELSKKLRELGVKQEDSLFYWIPSGTNRNGMVLYYYQTFDGMPKEDDVAAFTVAELGEILPQGFATFKSINGGWIATPSFDQNELLDQKSDTEADARAKMLVYLIENKLITL